MRALATILAGAMLLTTFTPVVLADEQASLKDRNVAWIIDQIGKDNYHAEATGTAVTADGEVQMTFADAVEMVAQQATSRGISLSTIGQQPLAGNGKFPLVAPLGVGVILEVGAGTGGLPLTCAAGIRYNVVATNTLNKVNAGGVAPFPYPYDGYIIDRMSTATQVDLAIGIGDVTGTVGSPLDIRSGYSRTIFAGPNFLPVICYTLSFCFFGICIWAILNLDLVSGVIADDGTDMGVPTGIWDSGLV